MRIKTIIKCIGLDDEIPKGFRFLESFECQWLLDNNFVVFNDIEKNRDYKLINKGGSYNSLWLHRLDNYSSILGDNRSLNNDSRVRGVLIINKDFKIIKV